MPNFLQKLLQAYFSFVNICKVQPHFYFKSPRSCPRVVSRLADSRIVILSTLRHVLIVLKGHVLIVLKGHVLIVLKGYVLIVLKGHVLIVLKGHVLIY